MNANARGIETIVRESVAWRDREVIVGINPYKGRNGVLHHELCIQDNGKHRMVYVDPYFENSSPALRNFLIKFLSGLTQHSYKAVGGGFDDKFLHRFRPEVRTAIRGALDCYINRIIKAKNAFLCAPVTYNI